MTPEIREESPEAHGLLVRATIFRPIAILVLAAAFVVVGIVAYRRIPLQLMPEGITFGGCGLYIPVPDSTPREVMEEIVKPAEDYLRTIPGIKSITSSSSARRASIRIEFSPRVDAHLMVAEIRDRVDRAKLQWPDGVDNYFVYRHDEGEMPVYIAAVSLDVDEQAFDIDYIFDEVIKKRLIAIDGVARVNIWGLLDKRVEIELDPNKVDAHAIDLLGLVTRLGSDNRIINAGSIRDDDKEYLVRVDGKFRSFADVGEYPASTNFHIKDFGAVDYGYAVRDRMSRVDGHRSRVIAINKESSANAVLVCDRITAALKELEGTLRRSVPGLKRIGSHSWMNQGEMIRYSIDSVKQSALFGALFAALVLYAFFRKVGMTLLVTLSIPFSILITVVWMFFRGQTFNLLSMMGLALGVGMLVDNSIVVVENILRHRAMGCSPRVAAIRGVMEVGLAVSLGSLTTVIVFLPGMFVSDPMVRGFFQELGEPVSISVLASLLVALVFVPQSAILLEKILARRAKLPALDEMAPERYSWCNRYCVRAAAWCLRHKTDALILTFGLFGFSKLIFDQIPKADMPMDGPRRLEINLKLPKNYTLRQADQVFAQVEKAILDRKAEMEIKSVTSWFGPTEGEINIFLLPGVNIKEDEFFKTLKPLLPPLPGVSYRLGYEDFGRNQGGQRLRVFVRGNDLDRLEEVGAEVLKALQDKERFPDLEEVSQWREVETEEVRVQVARRLAQEYGTDTAQVSRMVAWALRGAVLPDFEVEDRDIPFWINYGQRVKENVEVLNEVKVFRAGGEPVRLDNMASYSIVPGSGEIHRQNGKMTMGYSASAKGDLAVVKEKVEAYFRRFPLPDGIEISFRQDGRGFQQDFKNMLLAMTLAMVLVFFVMGILFESFLLPLSVLFSIPHAFLGSLLLLWILGVSLDMVGLLGVLMLVGIVVNNAIVLIDCINRLRLAGMPRLEAIERAIQVRFRPIWMTALTTICGLLPLIIFPQSGEGVDYKGLAVVLAGGLTTSTFFTLFVAPVFYLLLDDLRLYLLSAFRGVTARGSTPGSG